MACEENYWGYNYKAPVLVTITRIKGKILDHNRSRPVPAAIISVNGQKTMSDEDGNYLLNYIVPEDSEPNKLETGVISVSAPQYLPYNGTFQIFPFENIKDIELEYAVPVVNNAVSNGDTTQAIITDFQGVEDIEYVSVTYNLYESGEVIRVEYDMDYKGTSDNFTAYYQHIIPIRDIGTWFRITAKDKEGNTHRADFTINPQDTMLFKPVHP
jgi:hypothetical protein